MKVFQRKKKRMSSLILFTDYTVKEQEQAEEEAVFRA